jgi:para-aminobenzoate synthetase component 1
MPYEPHAPIALLENGPGGKPAAFCAPQAQVVAHAAGEVLPALQALDAARAKGKWIAGYLAYEAGLALEPCLSALLPQSRTPLLAFGIFDAPGAWPALPPPGPPLALGGPLVSRKAYGEAFGRALRYIHAGDCYQVNLSFPVAARLAASPLALFARWRAAQPVGHGAFLDFGAEAGPAIVSRSPELFFSVSAKGQIEARPMKGTAPRGADAADDEAAARALAKSPKDRAENLMIVDLLRNDLSRLARPGSVQVPELFAVERYATVFQMSSRVVAELAAPPALAPLMQALFPCGSITGAPKIRAMEILRELEPHPRGVYCGAIGWMSPQGEAAFNVAIRSLSAWPDGEALLNVGGGLVADSTVDGEWEEALWKLRYARL